MKKIWVPLTVAAAVMLAGCGDKGVYTLYRTSKVNNERVHMATFDSKEGDAYNNGNCQIVRELFERQPGVDAKYWCEAGSYKAQP